VPGWQQSTVAPILQISPSGAHDVVLVQRYTPVESGWQALVVEVELQHSEGTDGSHASPMGRQPEMGVHVETPKALV
jgi:hypothetical protein